MTTDPEDLQSYEYIVYFYAENPYDENDELRDTVSLDDVIEAGVKALGVGDRFQFVESDYRDSGHF